MNELPRNRSLPASLIEERPGFVPQLVLTDALKTVMREVVRQWRHRDRFAGLIKFGIRPIDRILFYGPPGNGKTLCCYHLSKQLGVPIFRVLCNQLRGSFMGETTANVAKVLDFLNGTTQPAICLFDEVEAIFVDRKQSAGQCDREIAAALTVFMQSLDRWKAPALIILATNLVGQLDEALLSRVELQVEFTGPTAAQATELVNYWSEMLCDNGGAEWGPSLRDHLAANPPASFRQIQQFVARAAREWTVKEITA